VFGRNRAKKVWTTEEKKEELLETPPNVCWTIIGRGPVLLPFGRGKEGGGEEGGNYSLLFVTSLDVDKRWRLLEEKKGMGGGGGKVLPSNSLDKKRKNHAHTRCRYIAQLRTRKKRCARPRKDPSRSDTPKIKGVRQEELGETSVSE